MNVLFCVFSGTGNTKKVAARFAEKLRALGHTTDTYEIKKGVPMPETEGFDVFVFGYPVHAFNAPKIVTRFLKKFPKGTLPFYLLRSEGEPSKLNDAAGVSPKRILRRKGYVAAGEFSYVMPYNILFRHSDKMAVRMWQDAERRIVRDALLVDALGGETKRVNLIRRATAFLFRIEHPAMPVLGKTFRTDPKKCVGCGKCAAGCPTGNIRMEEGRPKFGAHCAGCMACAFSCPLDAVKISLLNPWRVNGGYPDEGDPATDEEICRYLRKMYTNYFHESEEL